MVRNHGAGLLENSPTRASPEPQKCALLRPVSQSGPRTGTRHPIFGQCAMAPPIFQAAPSLIMPSRAGVPSERIGREQPELQICRAALERSDFAVRRVPLIFAWKKPQELDPGLPRTTQKKYHILLKRPHGTLAEKTGNGGFCSFVPRAITHKPPPLARFRRAVAT